MQTVSDTLCHGGRQLVLDHRSAATGGAMRFGLFLPPEPAGAPVLWYLSGLTCTHENAMTKAGLQVWAAEAGIALCFPDTSPRGEGVADDEAFDMGQGAGFYVDAEALPWARNFRMERYVAEELPKLLFASFDLDPERQGITGHSMGGHGALTLALKHPGRFASVSAFAPICNPSTSDWGAPQLRAYGLDPEDHDAALLLRGGAELPPCLVDAGTDDPHFDKLGLPAFAAAAAEARAEAAVNLRRGYDHSYFFVSTFAESHVDHHAAHLT
ncbi:S-formylglutathione hydrolase [Jannaschia sp. W003]|uniref:S-formylglutathione hydrolase n=1 Tax=Jannaschia sp. W003 TaxID=2867012 RepID=UPI0021A86E27|nr:S-formylglutathione hydrolase [Jannaschia sp. W003]UWQ21741.1 S-formylglutathione hydrolase [Jannaschia sp. W003]